MPQSISAPELLAALWRKKLLGVFVVSCFAGFSIVFSLLLPNVYRATALVAAAEETNGASVDLGGIAALGGIAGLNVSGTGKIDKKTMAIEVMKSRRFFIQRVYPQIKDSLLLSEAGLSSVHGSASEFTNITKAVKDKEQVVLAAHRKFLNTHLRIARTKMGFVEIGIDHSSPSTAKRWVDIVLREINEELRFQVIELSESTIEFLVQESKNTNLVSLTAVFSRLIEDQIKAKALANVEKDFAFVVVDPAYVPHERLKPNRTLICIIGILIGALSYLCIVLAELIYRGAAFHGEPDRAAG